MTEGLMKLKLQKLLRKNKNLSARSRLQSISGYVVMTPHMLPVPFLGAYDSR